MKINRRVKIFIALLSLLYLITLVQDTYAKYTSSANANTNITISRWNILVNDQDIKNNSNFTNTIKPTFEENENIASGVIAPTSKGYFDIIIDGTKTDVSFQYNINLALSSLNTVSDLKLTNYKVNDDDTLHQIENNVISNQVLYNSDNKIIKYRIFVEWIDGDSETMNNEADTEATINGIAAYDIAINITQIPN